MLKKRTCKRFAAGLVALALAAPAVAANTGDIRMNHAGLTAHAAEVDAETTQLEGGWEFSDIAADNVTDAQKASLEEALAETVGVTYEPKDVIAGQVVAGTNYAFLCKATPATLNPVSYWAIVSVYVDLNGKAALNHIAAIDPADVKVMESAAAPAPGSWTSEVKKNAAELPESVLKATSSLIGVSYSPIAVLGTQVVAGMNYRVLAYGSLATADAVTSLYVADIYVKPDGTAQITKIAPFDLLAYTTPESEEEVTKTDLADCTVDVDTEAGTVTVKNGDAEISDTEYSVVFEGTDNNYKGEKFPPSAGTYVVKVTAKEDSETLTGAVEKEIEIAAESEVGVAGGWEFSDIAADNVTDAQKASLEEALAETVGVTYEPKDVIAAQIVAGTNYAFLCKATPSTLNPESYWAIVSVYVDLSGKASLNNIAAIDPADVKVIESVIAPASGSWTSEAKENAAELPESVLKATSSLIGVSYSPIAVLGTQVVAGMNYRVLAYGSIAAAEAVTSLYVADIYVKPDGTAQITKIAPFDLLAYTTPESEEEVTKTDLADCAVDVDTKAGTVTVKDGDAEISADEYSLAYQGVDVDYIGEKFPTDHGTYQVTATAREESEVVTGSVSKEFEIAKAEKYFAEPDKLGEMSVRDFEQKNMDQKVAGTDVNESAEGTVTVVLKGDNGDVLNVYTLDAATGIGKDQNGETVDLPQTGNTSTTARNTALAALLMMAAGGLAVLRSGVFRKKREEK